MSNNNKISRNDSSELLACFDEEGNVIAPQLRSIIHEEPLRIWHGVTNIWVLNSKGKVLCTRRALHVFGNPGKWQTYLGGHAKAGSTFMDTALRELKEEINLVVSSEDTKLIEVGRRKDAMHFFKNYVVLFDRDLSVLNFSDGEITKAQWFTFEEYQKSKEKNPNNWCNNMKAGQYKKALRVLDIFI